jgi:hypothetical protein
MKKAHFCLLLAGLLFAFTVNAQLQPGYEFSESMELIKVDKLRVIQMKRYFRFREYY